MAVDILLSTLNARFHHSAFGLRYLQANLGELKEKSKIVEFIIKRPAAEIADEILSNNPKILGFGVYIWNTDQILEVLKIIRVRAPEICIVLGGPEISFETEKQQLFEFCDFVIPGEADFLFREFCQKILSGEKPTSKIFKGPLPLITDIKLPYSLYSDEDVRHRVIYVEASRGCPYKCEYCLSSLDVSVRNFNLEAFLTEMQNLIDRGVRKFKFVDRTFNLSPKISNSILEFFLSQVHLGLHLHFELVPDRLPDELKVLIEKFPHGSLQFEIGVQTWSPAVAANVSRRQNYQKISDNLKYLKASTGVHSHVDLIVGLPGETWDSFAAGFDQVYALQPDEIQVGLLKRLKGTPIVRHDEKYQMCYRPEPPYTILKTIDLDAEQIKRLQIFADFWDSVANSGRFPELNQLIREDIVANTKSAFNEYLEISDFLFKQFGRTHSIQLRDLKDALRIYFQSVKVWELNQVEEILGIKKQAQIVKGLERQSRRIELIN